MDLATFLINTLNKIEPITEDSKSLLRISLTDHFNKSNNIMQEFKEAEKENFKLDEEIANIPLETNELEYNKIVQQIERKRPKVQIPTILDKGVSFLSSPMARLGLYILFIIVGGYITKKMMKKKTEDIEHSEDQPMEFQRRKLSKKEKKRILKNYRNESI